MTDLSIIPAHGNISQPSANQNEAATWVCCKELEEGHTGSAPGLCYRPLYHGHSVKQEGRGDPPTWTVFPDHLPGEHLLIFQVLNPDCPI